MSLTTEQLQADVEFLLLRAGSAGSVSFTSDRWTGSSSNAIVSLAYGGTQNALPYDRGDYAACVRTVKRLPKHRKTAAVIDALERAREHYLARYPTDRFPLTRIAERERRKAEWEDSERQRKERDRAKRRRRTA